MSLVPLSKPFALALGVALAGALASADAQAAAVPATAQSQGVVAPAARDTMPRPAVDAWSPHATRAELSAALQAAQRTAAAGDRKQRERAGGEVAAIQRRLRNGDFQVGDRITVSLSGDTTRREVAVRDGVVIDLPSGIPPLSLAGVLRAELNDVVTAHFRKYLRDPIVSARPLLRLTVSGAVGRPGTYTVPYDTPVSEIVMAAGGLGSGSRVDEISIRRDGEEVVKAKQFTSLTREGRTVEQAGMRPGDEIFVPTRGNAFRFGTTARTVFFTLSALTAVLALIRSGYQ
jgi:protein involved in polysaccharide export with SLBB domain